ncbi:MAG: sodium-extruding oxaloacetate decarboxylase subunit alpha [Thiotrichales bacterium]
MPQVHITDTILRDAHQCLIATRMRTDDMLPACEMLDRVGYWSLEVWGGATFDACVRFLKEDPWERLRRLRLALPNTRLQMLLRGQNLLGYRHYGDDVVNAFVAKSADNGMDVFRIFDALNDVRNLETSIAAVKRAGKHAQGTICYTTSPVHDIDSFVKLGRELENLGCDSIAIKDMAGLLTPAVAESLVRALKSALSLPLHLHSHASSGLSEMCSLRAAENGCLHIDTAISSFAGGASHAPTESMVAAFRGTEFDTGLDLNLLQEISEYFREVRKKYRHFESERTGVDTRVQINQVPGGMISNMMNQLRDQNAEDKVNAVLAEIPRVRKDLGYPPLVTPTSQIVGTQAVMNVMTGTPYKVVTNEVKLYLKGHYGRAPGEINEEVRQLAIGNETAIDCRPADLIEPELEDLRIEAQLLADCEEDVLTFAMFPEIGRDFLEERKAGTLTPELLKPLQVEAAAPPQCPPAPAEFYVTVHGESFHVKVGGTGYVVGTQRPIYLTIDGVPEEVEIEVVDTFEGTEPNKPAQAMPQTPNAAKGGSRRPQARGPGDVTTAMPGTIIDVLVKEGDSVNAGDPLLITEAMKMETEIQAPVSGRVVNIFVAKGDRVNPDETLIKIEA